jgi:cell division protein FtsZ
LFEVNEAAEIIHGVAHPDANIIFGSVIDESMGEEVRVTVIAAGFERWEAQTQGRAGHTESAGRDETRSRVLGAEAAHEDIFAAPADDDIDLGDDDFDVPSFLR